MVNSQSQISKEIVTNIFNNIDERNNKLLLVIKEEKKELNNKLDLMTKLIQFRTKIDKIDASYHLIIPSKDIKKVKKIHEKTENVLVSNALKKTNGDELKAISLLFDPSYSVSDILTYN